jgi:hypothetical protein
MVTLAWYIFRLTFNLHTLEIFIVHIIHEMPVELFSFFYFVLNIAFIKRYTKVKSYHIVSVLLTTKLGAIIPLFHLTMLAFIEINFL